MTRTFIFSITNKQLLKTMTYYISNQARIKWETPSDETKIDVTGGEYLEIVSHEGSVHDEKHKYKNSRHGLFTTVASNTEYKIQYMDCEFVFTQKECGGEANEQVDGSFEYYKKLYMTTDAPEEIVSNLITDATTLYLEEMMNIKTKENGTGVFIYDDGYWELLTTRDPRNIDTVYLPKVNKKNIVEGRQQTMSIVDHLEHFLQPDTKAKFEELGIQYKCNYLLEGHWGTGKTSLITALATKFGYGMSILSFSHKLGDVELFKAIRRIRDNTFLVLEDIDSLFIDRKSGDTHKNRITFSGLLNVLDGIATPPGLITFITTNHKNKLDPALIRPGRIDYVMKFGFITKEQIREMFIKFSGLDDKDTQTEKFSQFYDLYRDLKIKITTGLLQQYLFRYLNDVDKIISNIDELKIIRDNLNEDKESNGLYN